MLGKDWERASGNRRVRLRKGGCDVLRAGGGPPAPLPCKLGPGKTAIGMLARKFEKYLIFASDVASFNLAFAAIFWLRYKSGLFPESFNPGKDFSQYTQIAFVLSLVWIAYFFISGLYRDWYLQSRAVQLGGGVQGNHHRLPGHLPGHHRHRHPGRGLRPASRAASSPGPGPPPSPPTGSPSCVAVNGFRMLACRPWCGACCARASAWSALLILGATEAGRKHRGRAGGHPGDGLTRCSASWTRAPP